MFIGPECQDVLNSLVQNNVAQDEAARALSKHLPRTDLDDSRTLTPQAVISSFISRFKSSLKPEDITYLQGLLDGVPTDNPELVVVHELHPSTEDPHDITSFLADGGIGRVWLAQDQQVQREVVLKQLLPGLQDNEGAKARFVHEAQVTGSLQHPNIVPVYSMNWDVDQSPFYTMKYIRGDTLAKRLDDYHNTTSESSGDIQTLLDRFLAICQAIAYAHENGIIHRDIKPENIAIGEFGEVTVLDWGLAESIQSPSGTVTTNGVLGTPNYMPPEQAAGNCDTGTYSDIYSLGAILYEILCGAPPRYHERQSQGLNALLTSIVEGDIPQAVDNCPTHLKGLGYISDRCLNRDPTLRYSNVGELIADIRAWSSDQPIAARPDNRFHSMIRKLRHNRRTVFASLILLPMVTFVLSVFVTNYNIEYSNLQAAKRHEVAKHDEYLKTKQKLAEAIENSTRAKSDADQNTKLAQQNQRLASLNRDKYLREQHLAEIARKENLLASESANIAAQKAVASTKAKSEAKILADSNRATAESLTKEIQRQIFNSLNRNAKQDFLSQQPQRALTWTSLALQHATAGQLASTTIQQQKLRYNILKSHIPQLQSIRPDNANKTLFLADPHNNSFHLALCSQGRTTLTKRSTQTLQPTWTNQIDGDVVAHCISTSTDIYCAVTTRDERTSRVLLFDSLTGDQIEDRVLPVNVGNPKTMYLTDNRFIFIQSNSISIFDRDSFNLQHETPAAELPIYDSAISPDGAHIATLHGQYELRIWDAREGLLQTQPINPQSPIASFKFTAPLGKLQLALGNGQQLTIDREEFTAKGQLQRTLPLSQGESVTASAFHSHQLFTAYGTSFGRLLISNVSGSLTIAPIQLNDSVTHIQLSKDNRILLIQSGRFTIHAYDILRRTFLCRNLDHPAAIEHCLLSPDNRFILAYLASSELRQWDLATPSFAPFQVTGASPYLHVQYLKGTILAVTEDGQAELRRATKPFELIASKPLQSSTREKLPFHTSQHGCFRIEDKQLYFIRHDNNDIQIDKHALYAPTNGFSVHAVHGKLAMAHSDRTVSIYSPSEQPKQRYYRLDGFSFPYESIEWISSSELVGLVYDHDQNETIIEQFSITDSTIQSSHTFSGIGYEFLRDSNGHLSLTDSHGQIFSPDPDDGYVASSPLAAPLKQRSHNNPTIAILENGLTQRLSNGNLWEFRSMFPTHISTLSNDGHFALATGNQIEIYNTTRHEPLAPPLFLPHRIYALDISRSDDAFHLIAATSAGLLSFDLSASDTPTSDLAIETLALTGTLVNIKRSVIRSPEDAVTASLSLSVPATETASPLGWLRAHSSLINPDYWEPQAKALVRRQGSLPTLTSQQATRLIDETVQAQIGAKRFKSAVSTLLNGHTSSQQHRHLYQACVLAAWLEDIPLYHQALQQFHDHVDLNVPQQFVDFSAASAILPNQLNLETLDAAYKRIKDTPSSNPVVIRALLINAWRLNDSERIKSHFQSLLDSRASLPIRNFCATILLLHTSSKNVKPSAIRTLKHNHKLTISIDGGNPGSNWAERCLADVALRLLLDRDEVQP